MLRRTYLHLHLCHLPVDKSNENEGSPSPVEIINTCDELIVQIKQLNFTCTHKDNNLAVLNKFLEFVFPRRLKSNSALDLFLTILTHSKKQKNTMLRDVLSEIMFENDNAGISRIIVQNIREFMTHEKKGRDKVTSM